MSLISHTDPKAKRLHEVAIFKNADKKALARLSSVVDEVKVPAGHELISQGHFHSESFVVEKGTAEVFVDDELVAEISEGEMIGELGIFVRGSASATVRAKNAMTVVVIPHNAIDQILDDNPAMMRVIAQELAVRLRGMDARHH